MMANYLGQMGIDVLVVEEGMEKGVLDAFAAQDVRIVCA